MELSVRSHNCLQAAGIHTIGELVRNLITVEFGDEDTYKITVENVNEYNLQPCSICIQVNTTVGSVKAGLAVGAEWVPHSILKSFDDTRSVIQSNTKTN